MIQDLFKRKWYPILTLLLLSTGVAHAQNMDKVDSLRALLPTQNDSLAATIYAQLRAEYHYVDFDQAEEYLNEELALAQKTNLPTLLIESEIHAGNHFSGKGDVETASDYYYRAMDRMHPKKDGVRIATLLNRLGSTYCSRGYYNKGMEKFQEAFKIVDTEWPESKIKGECLLSLGMIHGTLDNYELSNDYLEQAIAFFKEIKDDPLRYETIMMLGVNKYENGQNEAANIDFIESVAFFENEYDDAWRLIKGYSNLGASYLGLGKYDEAESYFQKGLKLSRDENFEHLEMIMLQRMGEVKMYKEKHLEALPYWKQTIPLAIQLEDVRAQAKTQHFLSICYDTLRNYKLAFSHYKEHVALNDSILSEQKIHQMNELEKKYQTEKKEQEIILLEEKNRRIKAEKNGIIGGIIALLALFSALIYAMRQRMIKNKLAREKTEQQLEYNLKELEYKKQELTAFALQLAHKNEVLEKIKSDVNEINPAVSNGRNLQKIVNTIDINQNDDDAWEDFRSRFLAVHKDFEVNIKRQYPKVSANELRLMALLKMQLSSKEIANILNISSEGIKKARYRLRKKLGLESSDSLEDLILSF